ncbi:hypothetical protein ACBY01_03860 [Sphingomonas sp. ac-8]|uniref:hypothetical protein n=1 Tax=Sphingomonas sp. ac-8 TaxID=3242977 RepID=UPI003A7FE76E
MKKFVVAAALGATMLTGVAHAGAQDNQPQRRPGPMAMLDANNDGVVTREEATAAADRHFDRIDRNRNGRIDKDEVRPRHRRGPGAASGETPPPPPPGAVQPLQTDRDGRIDKPARGKRAGGMRMGMGARMLARADANRDGAVDRAEFRAAALAHFDRVDANRDGRIDAAEREAMKARMGARAGHKGAPPAPTDGARK